MDIHTANVTLAILELAVMFGALPFLAWCDRASATAGKRYQRNSTRAARRTGAR